MRIRGHVRLGYVDLLPRAVPDITSMCRLQNSALYSINGICSIPPAGRETHIPAVATFPYHLLLTFRDRGVGPSI